MELQGIGRTNPLFFFFLIFYFILLITAFKICFKKENFQLLTSVTVLTVQELTQGKPTFFFKHNQTPCVLLVSNSTTQVSVQRTSLHGLDAGEKPPSVESAGVPSGFKPFAFSLASCSAIFLFSTSLSRNS